MSLEDIFFGVLGVSLVLFLFTGTILSKKGLKMHDKGLLSLGLGYFTIVVIYLLIGFYTDWIWIYALTYITYSFVLLFTQNTFYQGKKTPIPKVFVFGTVMYLIIWIPKFIEGFYWEYWGIVDNGINELWTALIFGTLAHAAYQSHQELKNSSVQPWIKKRIKIVMYSAVIQMFINVPDFLGSIFEGIPYDLRFSILASMVFIFVSGQFLAWVMPPKFKAYLNRELQEKQSLEVKEEELSEEEIIRQMEMMQ